MIGNGQGGIYIRYTRLARVVDGLSYYVVPVSPAAPFPGLPARCAAEINAKLRAELPQIPVRLRAPTLALAARLLATDVARGAAASQPGVCLFTSSAGGHATECAATASQLEQHGLLAMFGRVGGAAGDGVGSIVPDGVATVTLRYPATGRLPARTATASVVGNVFATVVPAAPNRGAQHPAITWRSASGGVLRTIAASTTGLEGSSSTCSSRTRNGCG
jgi:hypothetical protein